MVFGSRLIRMAMFLNSQSKASAEDTLIVIVMAELPRMNPVEALCSLSPMVAIAVQPIYLSLQKDISI